MVRLEEMSREELIEVVKMKDELLNELKDEIGAYRMLVDELQTKLGIMEHNFSGNGD